MIHSHLFGLTKFIYSLHKSEMDRLGLIICMTFQESNKSRVAVNSSVHNKTPSNKFVVAINVPYPISSISMIDSPLNSHNSSFSYSLWINSVYMLALNFALGTNVPYDFKWPAIITSPSLGCNNLICLTLSSSSSSVIAVYLVNVAESHNFKWL